MSTVILLKEGADANAVRHGLSELGLWPQPIGNDARGARGFTVSPFSKHVSLKTIEAVDGVDEVLETPSTHPRLDALKQRVIDISIRQGTLQVGAGSPAVLAAGPCAAESEEQVHRCAQMVQQAGGKLLRGGAYKPRTTPYSFAGFGAPALSWLRDAADAHGLGLVTEVMSEHDTDAVGQSADLIQIGSRNMQNFALLKAVGACQKPVMLKRGVASTLSEWRHAAEHLLHAGAPHVIFCARGVRGPSEETRNVLDLGAVALLKHVDGHTIFVDPSHAAGRRDLILPLAQAALAAGADGLLIETHPNPGSAHSDGPQALLPEELSLLGQILSQQELSR